MIEKKLATWHALTHNYLAAQTNAAGFGDLDSNRRTTAAQAVFFRPYSFDLPLWAGDRGDTFGYAGFRFDRFANPTFCPPTSFGDERRAPIQTGANHG